MIRSCFTIILFLLLLACSPLGHYRNLPEIKGWEGDILKFQQLDNIEHYQADAIMFAGSSSIRLWSTLAEDMAPYSVIQRGYGGAKFSDFAVYADRIFDSHPCKGLVLFIANDITGDEEDKKPEEVKRLFLNVLKTFRRTHPDTPVFYVAVTPTPLRWKAWTMIVEGNNLIRRECEKHKDAYFIRTDYAFLGNDGEPRAELFRNDRLHLDAEGYKIWTRIIKSELDLVFK
jgi:hypothetical protein